MTAAKGASSETKAVDLEHSPRKRARHDEDIVPTPKKAQKLDLSRIMNVPPEVFNEIAIYLSPTDLLSLSRSIKFFRKILMSRSSRHVWQTALRNVPELPDCSPYVCEPQNVEAKLLVVWILTSSYGIAQSAETKIREFKEDHIFLDLIPHSGLIGPPKTGYCYVLRQDADWLLDKSEGDKYSEWYSVKKRQIRRRQRLGVLLFNFLEKAEQSRELELHDLKVQRREEIESRLLEGGWTKRDMTPARKNEVEWRKLVSQPKPITERVWMNLYPKLVILLQSNRASHEYKDRKMRQRDCINRLDKLVTEIRQALPPLVHVTLKRPPARNQGESSSAYTSVVSDAFPPKDNYPDVKIDMPFPSMTEILAWPMIKAITGHDILPEELEQRLKKVRERFDQAVFKWRNEVEQGLVNIWQNGRAECEGVATNTVPPIIGGEGQAAERTGTRSSTGKSEDHESTAQSSTIEAPSESFLPRFSVAFTNPNGATTTNLSELSPNLQILLRADTMFKSPRAECTYPGIVSQVTVTPGGNDEPMHGQQWDASEVTRDDEASAAAKVLLARFGRPEATAAEMKALGQRFQCGKCNRGPLDDWEQLMSHYGAERRNWKTAQEKIEQDPDSSFIYNNTHDFGSGSVWSLNPSAAADYMSADLARSMQMMTCKKCEQMDIPARYFHIAGMGVQSPIVRHLRDIHNVTEPELGLHFERWKHGFGFADSDELSSEDD
ncbi:hypothetical protein FRC07_001888 [Ceratobasidium sp. 392]|nr:hypothetical protein FRC07_001888 [Ceratobasidium sp. 392]